LKTLELIGFLEVRGKRYISKDTGIVRLLHIKVNSKHIAFIIYIVGLNVEE
jgi:hypothetical protein